MTETACARTSRRAWANRPGHGPRASALSVGGPPCLSCIEADNGTDLERARWQAIYEAAYPTVFRALVAVGARPDEAEDALHDAFEAALSRSYEIERPDAWLFVVAVRRWRRRRFRERIFRPLGRVDRPTSSPDGARVTLLEELARLTPRQREVIVARYVLGLSQEETAGALGIARGTVAATTTQATALLRRRLKEEE